MKRILSFTLALLLALCVFSSCAKSPPGEPTTAPPIEETTANNDPTQASPVFSLPELPDLGDFVPGTAPTKCFFRDGPAEGFTPRDDYGPLIPYIADAVYLTSPQYTTWTNPETGEEIRNKQEMRQEQYQVTWGLAIPDGRVVTKGLFSSVEYYAYSDDEGFFILRGNALPRTSEEEPYVYPPTILTDKEGRWAVEIGQAVRTEPLFDFGLPLLLAVDGKTNSAVFYDLDGKAKADMSKFVTVEYHYPNFPYLAYADEEGLLMTGVPDEDGGSRYNTVSRVDWDGNVLSTAQEKGADAYYAGGKALILRNNENKYDLMSLSGERLTDEKMIYLDYSPLLGGFIGRVKVSASRYEARYFDEYGLPAEVENAWTDSTIYALHADHAVTDGRGKPLLFVDRYNRHVAFDLWGNKLPLPAEGNAATVFYCFTETPDRYYTSYYAYGGTDTAAAQGNPGVWFFIRTASGNNLLCREDGEILAGIEPPVCIKQSYRNGYDVAVSAQNGCIFVVTEKGDLVVYDGKTGEEKTRLKGFLPEVTEETNFWDLYVSHYGDNFVGTSTTDGGYVTNRCRLYCLSKPEEPLGIFSYVSGNRDCLSAISGTQAWLFDGEGNVLLRFTLPDFY